jgi:hypothetical protein
MLHRVEDSVAFSFDYAHRLKGDPTALFVTFKAIK